MSEESADDAPLLSFKLFVTIAVTGIFLVAAYMLYAGATGAGEFRRVCDGAKGKVADEVLARFSEIASVGEPAANGTVIVQHADGPRCVVRVTDKKVFSSLYEE